MAYTNDLVIGGKSDGKKLIQTADAIYAWLLKKKVR